MRMDSVFSLSTGRSLLMVNYSVYAIRLATETNPTEYHQIHSLGLSLNLAPLTTIRSEPLRTTQSGPFAPSHVLARKILLSTYNHPANEKLL